MNKTACELTVANNSFDVTITLSEVSVAVLGRVVTLGNVRAEDSSLSFTLSSNTATHPIQMVNQTRSKRMQGSKATLTLMEEQKGLRRHVCWG